MQIYNMEGSDIYSNAIIIETIWKTIVGIEIKKEKKEDKMDIGDERSLMSDDPVRDYLLDTLIYCIV